MKLITYSLFGAIAVVTIACSNVSNPGHAPTQPSKTEIRHQATDSAEEHLATAMPEEDATKSKPMSVAPAEPPAKYDRERKHGAGNIAAAPTVSVARIAQGDIASTDVPLDAERYAHLDQSGVVQVAEHPVSTFSIDVDTAAYANVRRMLRAGRLPQSDAVLVEEMSSTLNTIAKDVKIQIEFNPDVVAEYRLIGYENRALKREDFSNDKVDAGEIGAGHSVTALYEIALRGSTGAALEPLRYQTQSKNEMPLGNELAHLRLRYKEPEGNVSKLWEWPLQRKEIQTDIARTSETFRFAAAVAGFGQLLKGGKYTTDFGYGNVAQLARGAKGDDRFGYRDEFLALVKTAESLSTAPPKSRHLSDARR